VSISQKTEENLATLHERPVELLRNLIRFDTTNPPGNEAACIRYINNVFTDAGFETTILASSSSRANLVTRLAGQGHAPPLLIYGHLDVVTTENQNWTYPPFEATMADGYVWGRGTLDMKGGVAMMMAALLRAKAKGLAPPGDVVLAVVSDEEAGGDYGARYLVENHAELFDGIRYAIGEAGGFSLHIGGSTVYPIMVAEKQMCWMKATVRGEGGHGSMPVKGQAMAKLAQVLQRLDRHRLPVHVTQPTRQMIESVSSVLPTFQRLLFRQLLNPALTDRILGLMGLMGPMGELMDPLLHNTVSPTVLRGSTKTNVIPSQATVELDGRLLPGFTADDMRSELHALLGDEAELTVIRYEPGPPEPDMGMFDTLADILREADPGSTPGPLVLSAVTDARHFSRLGIQTYGFTPMKMPPELSFWRLAHAANERIPVDSLEFGIEAIYKLLQRFGEAC
jgi:acetylornithine deacetylase/succinyl-diaminopimelate desuccinylase-like protein